MKLKSQIIAIYYNDCTQVTDIIQLTFIHFMLEVNNKIVQGALLKGGVMWPEDIEFHLTMGSIKTQQFKDPF